MRRGSWGPPTCEAFRGQFLSPGLGPPVLGLWEGGEAAGAWAAAVMAAPLGPSPGWPRPAPGGLFIVTELSASLPAGATQEPGMSQNSLLAGSPHPRLASLGVLPRNPLRSLAPSSPVCPPPPPCRSWHHQLRGSSLGSARHCSEASPPSRERTGGEEMTPDSWDADVPLLFLQFNAVESLLLPDLGSSRGSSREGSLDLTSLPPGGRASSLSFIPKTPGCPPPEGLLSYCSSARLPFPPLRR